ncbi:MAG: hypothetical protein RLZZ293_846 [Pseudomonadota bacterium]|jgi:DNA-binding CsgD family transcriptional regulator
MKNNDLINKVNSLSNDEYLDLLIKLHFSTYDKSNIFLSVFNLQKQICYASKATLKVFYRSNDFDNLSEHVFGLKSSELKTYARFYNATKEFEHVLDLVLQQRNSVIFIVFEKYKNLLGALHIRIDPIFHPNGEICGFNSRSYDYTRLFWGAELFGQDHTTDNKNLLELHSFTEKQRQVLFLLAINYTQDAIANILGITRGTISRIISQICRKLDLDFHSASFLLTTLGRRRILESLAIPELDFKPIIIILENTWTHNID